MTNNNASSFVKNYYRLAVLSLTGFIASFFVFTGMAQATTLSGSELVRLDSTGTGYSLGRAQAVGDINGDGYQDLVIGAHSAAGTSVGHVYIVYGQADMLSALSLSSVTVTELTGASVADQAGVAVAVGDLNNDSYDDIVVGANNDDVSGTNSGTAYVVYGGTDQIASGSLSAFPRFLPEASGDGLGGAVAIGDFNNDGNQDILLGANRNDDGASNAGSMYIYYGDNTTITSNVSVSGYYELTGEAASNSAGSALTVGDFDNDGYDDFVVGALNYGGIGAAYVVYGQDMTNSATTTSLSSATRFSTGSTGDTFGSVLAVGDINGDGYSDLAIGASGSDVSGTNAGAVNVLYGTSSDWTTSSFASAIAITGKAAADSAGTAVHIEDMNKDGFAELMIGAINNADGGAAAGSVYIINGASTALTSTGVETLASHEFTGEVAENSFGRSIATPDFNGDGVPELTIGAPGYNSMGAVYVGYLGEDADGDGVLSTTGTVYTGVDTNDTVVNNGVEVMGDEIDNDGDGEVDEKNTLDENGVHPYYGTLEANADVTSSITSVVGGNHGKILVTYADDSVYKYSVYSSSTSASTSVEQYQNKGYAVVLHKKGKKAYLMNILTGEKTKTLTLTNKNYSKSAMQLKDVRNDGKVDVVVIGKKGSRVGVYLLKVKTKTEKMNVADSVTLRNKKVNVNKTKVAGKKITLRNSKRKALQRYTVTKRYKLVAN